MTNSNGTGPARPESDAGQPAAGCAHPADGAVAAHGTAPAGAHHADLAAQPATPDAPPPADGPEAPEIKEKNKMFEAVRLKARLTMSELELAKLRTELEQLRAAPADYQDKNMRLMAEMENLRRRMERERADTAKFAITRFARDVLTVADNFQRAVDVVPKTAVTDDGPLKTLFEGVDLTARELLSTLERHGVKRIDPTGMKFDPNLHQAMMQVDNADVPNGTVMQAFQPAYMIEDRILRPAMVVVSRGGPKPPKSVDAMVSVTSEPLAGGTEPDLHPASDRATTASTTSATSAQPSRPPEPGV